jgi:hypothetical protein
MALLSDSSYDFKIPCSDEDENRWKVHLPDIVVTTILKVAEGKLEQLFQRHFELLEVGVPGLPSVNEGWSLVGGPRLSWDEAKQLVAEAYEAFDPRLWGRVRAALADPTRISLREAEIGDAAGWFHKNIAETDRVPAPIEYARDGTVNDVLTPCHEFGHLLASDCALARATSDRDRLMCHHLAETQGFFGQWIGYDSLSRSEDPELRGAAWRHLISQRVCHLYMLPACLAAQRYERGEGSWGDADEFFAPMAGQELDRLAYGCAL